MSFYTLEDFHSNNHLFKLTMSAAVENKNLDLGTRRPGLALPCQHKLSKSQHFSEAGFPHTPWEGQKNILLDMEQAFCSEVTTSSHFIATKSP